MERRSEKRIALGAPAELIPLAAVSTSLRGRVVDISGRGVKVHLDSLLNELPRTGDAYRLLSGREVMLCEVRNMQLEGEGGDIGLKILHWTKAGKLNRVTKVSAPMPQEAASKRTLRILRRIPGLRTHVGKLH